MLDAALPLIVLQVTVKASKIKILREFIVIMPKPKQNK